MGTADRVRKAFRVHQAAGALDRGATQNPIDGPASSAPPPTDPNATFSLPDSHKSPPGGFGYSCYSPDFNSRAQYDLPGLFSTHMQAPNFNNNGAQPPNRQYGQYHTGLQLQTAQQSQHMYQQPTHSYPSVGHQQAGPWDNQFSTSSPNHDQSNFNVSTPQYHNPNRQPQYFGGPAYAAPPQASPVSETQSLYSPLSSENSNQDYHHRVPIQQRSQTMPNMSSRSGHQCEHDLGYWDSYSHRCNLCYYESNGYRP